MWKILSIDIDYIMAPSIHVYDDWVNDHWVDTHIQWKMITQKMGVEPISCEKRVKYLLQVYEKALSSLKLPEQIKFSKDHHQLLNYVGDRHDLIIDNIDHHHDIFYEGWNSVNEVNEGNWVWWLDHNHQLQKYTWYGNKNSESYDQSMPFRCEYDQVFDRRRRPMTDPDFIFICESPQWVPPGSRQLFKIMRKRADNYFKEHNHNETNSKTS